MIRMFTYHNSVLFVLPLLYDFMAGQTCTVPVGLIKLREFRGGVHNTNNIVARIRMASRKQDPLAGTYIWQ